MQEIWIEDKQNPDAIRKPLKSYVIVHVHHHVKTRETRVDRVEDIKAKNLRGYRKIFTTPSMHDTWHSRELGTKETIHSSKLLSSQVAAVR